MNPLLRQYLESKLGSDYAQKQQSELESAQSSARLGNLFGDLGDVVSGQRIGSTDAYFQKGVDGLKSKQSEAEKKALAEYDMEKSLKADQADQEKLARENDVNSPESKLAQSLASKLGADPALVSGLTASKWKQFSPAYEKMYELEQKKAENQLKRQELGQKKQELQDLKIQEKQNQLETPFGLAQTADDAKQLKAASEEKANFDRKIQELIDLRTSKGGGEMLDREAVSRAKQLSKDLLLAYKNMAKLGVLSSSDEAIINAIIPADPLQFNSPLAAMQGQDPILNNLKKFKADSDADFNQKLMNRLRQPEQAVKNANTPQTKEINGEMYEKVNGGWQKVKKDAAR
jgi:hypothetical protein